MSYMYNYNYYNLLYQTIEGMVVLFDSLISYSTVW